MKRRTIVTALIISATAGLIACSETQGKTTENGSDTQEQAAEQTATVQYAIKPEDVQLTNPLNAEWVAAGKGIYELKCQSCHKLTDEKLVGPGWKGVTKRRQPYWILNMVTHTDMMLEQDPEAQKLLEQCLVRMPNQNLTEEEARKVLEFQRSNDGEK